MSCIRWVTAGLVVALLATGVAMAQGPRSGGPGGRGMRGGGPLGVGLPLRELQLTDAQQQQIHDIRSRHETQLREAASRVESARAAQRKAVEAIPANEAQITAVTQDLVQAEVEVAIQASRLNTEIWSVLTSEQQAKAKELRVQREARQSDRREQFRDRRRQ
jgi:Spy/CpxP family protein refolding chaperone